MSDMGQSNQHTPYGIEGPTPEKRRAARQTVAHHALGVDDCALLLEMLGLDGDVL